MKEQFKVSAIVFVIVFFAVMLFATLYTGGTANAFTQEELDECDRLFLAAVGETVDQSGEADSFVANKRIVYDADLRELGIVYSYTSNSGNGYAVIVVQDEITVSEIVEGNDPYANLPGTPIYINQFTYAGYVDGNYVFENGATLTRAQINAYVGYHGAGTLTLDSTLCDAAATRAREIASYFSHTRLDGSQWYTVSSLAHGENIIMGTGMDADRAMTDWMNSQGHRDNILDDSYGSLGVGCCQSGREIYWVQLFGY